MKLTSLAVTAAVALLAALAGGVVATRISQPAAARAQADAISADLVTTREFQIIDAAGKVRLRAGVLGSGETFLTLRDDEENPRLLLNVLPDGAPVLTMRDRTNGNRISLDLHNWTPSLMLSDVSGQPRVRVGQWEDGAWFLRLSDGQGRERVVIGEYGNGDVMIETFDAAGASTFTAPGR